MSASEKLKALGGKALAPWYFEGDDHREEDFRPFLPHIVAVIDVAEKIATTDDPVWGTKDGLGFKLQDRLADLEEALS